VSKAGITTHVLDTAQGRPAEGVPVTLERATSTGWEPVGSATTDTDGRASGLLSSAPDAGDYRLTFDTRGRSDFYPEVSVTFTVKSGQEHYHVPLLLSPFGYSTYRGS
jgi:5-hydroxyisourate hydrolase